MPFMEWAMDYPLHRVDETEFPMTRMEKLANNFTTIVIARFAMAVTPLLLSFFIWLFWQVYSSLDTRVIVVEKTIAAQSSTIQDHESRLVFGHSQREALEAESKERFTDIGDTLNDLQRELGTLNGSIIRLQTTVENRLPSRANGEPQ